MRLSCPNCSTEYEVPDAALAGRSRTLKCERCGTQWRTPEPVADIPLATPEPTEIAAPLSLPPEPLFATAPSVWPSLPDPDDLNISPPPAPHFGHPVDDAAQAELDEAVVEEEKIHPAHDLPAPTGASEAADPTALPEFPTPPAAELNTSDGLPLFLSSDRFKDTSGTATTPAKPDGYADLVHAARNNNVEYEPEPPPRTPQVRTSNKPLFILLVVVFVIACILVEHAEISRLFPSTTKFFHALGLK